MDSIQQYTKGSTVCWSAYSSSSADLNYVKKHFAKQGGIIIILKIEDGKSIRDYSRFIEEEEVLLSPNLEFIVTKGIEKHPDGYSYVKLMQTSSNRIIF